MNLSYKELNYAEWMIEWVYFDIMKKNKDKLFDYNISKN